MTLNTTLTHRGSHPMQRYFPDFYGGDWLAFEAQGEISSDAFGVTSASTIGLNGKIQIEIRTEMQKRQ